MIRYSAAICRVEGWTANRAIFHKGWTTRKVDPAQLDIRTFRGAVTARLAPSAHVPLQQSPADGGEMFNPKLVSADGATIYVTTLTGAAHFKNRTHRDFLVAGGVPDKVDTITSAQLAALLEKEA